MKSKRIAGYMCENDHIYSRLAFEENDDNSCSACDSRLEPVGPMEIWDRAVDSRTIELPKKFQDMSAVELIRYVNEEKNYPDSDYLWK